MKTTKHVLELPPEVIRSFTDVRARVQSAVAAQRRPVTLAEALDQVKRFQRPIEIME